MKKKRPRTGLVDKRPNGSMVIDRDADADDERRLRERVQHGRTHLPAEKRRAAR